MTDPADATELHAPTTLGTRSVMRLRHGGRLLREVGSFTVLNRVWWFLPLVILVLLLTIAATATQHALPYAVYTLF